MRRAAIIILVEAVIALVVLLAMPVHAGAEPSYDQVQAQGQAGGLPAHSLTFDDAAQQIVFVIPNPACSDGPGCTWRMTVYAVPESGPQTVLFISENNSQEPGPWRVNYPAGYCGRIQADISVGDTTTSTTMPFMSILGFQHDITTGACAPPTTTTTVPPPPSTTLPQPTTTTTSTTLPPAPVVATTVPPSQPTDCSQGGFAGCSGGGANGGTGLTSADSSGLAFTGADYGLLGTIGLLLVAIGLTLTVWRKKAHG